ncbi:MAG TPA: class I SAM-dependent methyltransferase [Candidatus Saccharimonadales bacterium]|nr:class I SAM-dependent methyltransferase [Candidatus Saccharimonadales bacterium]
MTKLTPQEEITKQSYDSVAADWADTHKTVKFWQDNFDEFFRLLPSGRLLEIGCGSGRDARELIGQGYDYVGTDISGPQLEQARKNNPGADFKQVSLYDLDFDKPFDGFWAAAVLIHVPKSRIDEALSSITKNMKAKAIGFIAMKEGEGEELQTKDYLKNTPYFFAFWQRGEFREVLTRHGMTTLHEDYIPMSHGTKWLTYIVRFDGSPEE